MRAVVISDTHNKYGDLELPEADMIINCGDYSGVGSVSELLNFANWFKDLDYKYKLTIHGNHDWASYNYPWYAKEIFQERDVVCLQDEAIEIGGVKFWGSPFSVEFCNWAWMQDRGSPEIKATWNRINDDTEVLITHGPCLGKLDWVEKSHGHVGCADLGKRIKELGNLKFHLSGHIHCAYGQMEEDGVTYINASSCNEQYEAVNAPIVIEVG